MCLIINKTNMIDLSSQISAIIEENTISQEHLSTITKISLKRITGFVNGTVIPSYDELLILSKIFNVSISSILSGTYHQIECTNKNCIYNENKCLANYLLLDNLGQCMYINKNVSQLGHILNKVSTIQNEHDIICNENKCQNNINKKCILKKVYINTVGQCEEFKWRKNISI